MNSKSRQKARREILLKAQTLVLDIEQLEGEIDHHQRHDMPAYKAWFEAHFTEARQELERLESEYAATVQMHNWIVAVSRMQKLSMPEAFLVLKQEENLLFAGDERSREHIVQQRQKREDFMRDEMAKELHLAQVLPLPSTSSKDSLKLVYRKLARRLHPDAQDLEQDSLDLRWQDKLWHLAQDARRQGLTHELESLYRVTLLRQLDLKELTLEDAHDAHEWLNKEIERLESELSQAKLDPSWQFLQRSCTDALWAQVHEQLKRERSDLVSEIKQLKGQHAYLEVISHTGVATAKLLKPRRRTAKTVARPPRHDDAQLSLF